MEPHSTGEFCKTVWNTAVESFHLRGRDLESLPTSSSYSLLKVALRRQFSLKGRTGLWQPESIGKEMQVPRAGSSGLMHWNGESLGMWAEPQ